MVTDRAFTLAAWCDQRSRYDRQLAASLTLTKGIGGEQEQGVQMATQGHARFTALDGMRGAAAITVVMYHVGILLGTPSIPRGYLAVDLFFALSGFVLSFSYDRRFAAGMSTWEFMRLRFVRLMPLYWAGWALGVIGLLAYGNAPGVSVAPEVPVSSRLTAATLNFFLLPFLKGRAGDALFPLNGPGWSLFYELFVANLVFAAGWSFLKGKKMALFILASFVWLAAGARLHRSIAIGSFLDMLPYAPARVLVSFFIGVAVHRARSRLKPARVPSWLLIALALSVFFVPLQGPAGILFDMFCVLIVFPTFIVLGAVAKERNPSMGAMLGDASYALYSTHYPALCIIVPMMRRFGVGWSAAGALPLTAALFGMGFLFHRYYDGPARAWLARLILRRT
jgi:peptidoglycan/LPS O-acetylase OafA/YrhL